MLLRLSHIHRFDDDVDEFMVSYPSIPIHFVEVQYLLQDPVDKPLLLILRICNSTIFHVVKELEE